ncbi:MAG TPA: NUDIX hydrolase [Candidatus Saccharimonadales bacterium]
MHHLFKVVTKAAIYSHDKSKVLVIHMDRINGWGLPGGHIEEKEEMNDAMRRELFEECGVEPESLKKVDFFYHSNGKIVLAYAGTLKSDGIISKQDNLEGIPKWLTREDFEKIEIEPDYRRLVLDNWI